MQGLYRVQYLGYLGLKVYIGFSVYGLGFI